MSCHRFDKLISLFLDKRLNRDQERELKEHLAQCPECKEKLSFLQSIENKTKGIKAQEPPEEYWNTFSSRVREKIIIQREKSSAFGWKRFLDYFFSFSPLKIKVAAGVVSVLFVFIIGKLYMDYRGGEILPWEKTAKVQETPKSVVMDMESEEDIAHVVSEEEAAVDRKGEIIPPKKEDQVKTIPPKSEEATTPQEVAEEKTAPVSAPEVAIPATTELGAEGQIEIPESKPTGAGVDREAKKKRGIKADIVKPSGLKDHDSLKVSKLEAPFEAQLGLISKPQPLQVDAYDLNGNSVPKIEEADTTVPTDTLKMVIQAWKTFILENPADSLSEEGYLQVATAYYLLIQTSQDTGYISESSEVINQNLLQSKNPAVQSALRDQLIKIQALRQK